MPDAVEIIFQTALEIGKTGGVSNLPCVSTLSSWGFFDCHFFSIENGQDSILSISS